MIPAHHNPFRSERIDALAFRPQGTDWDALLARLHALAFRAAIVGPRGAGKTTLLDALPPRLAQAGLGARRFRIDAARPRLPALRGLGAREVALVDGVESLSRFDRWRLLRATRRAGGLVVTAHAPTALPTLIECTTSRALLAALTDELAPGAFPAHALDACFARHRGDVRACLRALYDAHGLAHALRHDALQIETSAVS